MKVGDKVRHTINEKTGVITEYPLLPEVCMVDWGKGPAATRKSLLEVVAKSSTPRYLAIAKSTPELQEFFVALHTPEVQCLLGLEARNEREDENIRKQYRDLTGEELVEGEGYNVAPLSAGKHGPEGYVTFNMPMLINMGVVIPEEISARMIQRPGLINHLDFLWLLVEQGFRVNR